MMTEGRASILRAAKPWAWRLPTQQVRTTQSLVVYWNDGIEQDGKRHTSRFFLRRSSLSKNSCTPSFSSTR